MSCLRCKRWCEGWDGKRDPRSQHCRIHDAASEGSRHHRRWKFWWLFHVAMQKQSVCRQGLHWELLILSRELGSYFPCCSQQLKHIKVSLRLEILTIIKDLYCAFHHVWQGNDLGDSSFICCDTTKTRLVQPCVNLLNKLQGEERKNEGLVFQHDHKHILAKFDGSYNTIEGDFSSILSLMIVPNDNFVTGGW